MPGSVQNGAPASVLPHSLCRAFAHEREYPAIENEYRNGESQRSVQASNSRKRWRIAKRLTPAQLQALRDFHDARKGPTEPFYFYDPYETNPKYSRDPTGQACLNLLLCGGHRPTCCMLLVHERPNMNPQVRFSGAIVLFHLLLLPHLCSGQAGAVNPFPPENQATATPEEETTPACAGGYTTTKCTGENTKFVGAFDVICLLVIPGTLLCLWPLWRGRSVCLSQTSN